MLVKHKSLGYLDKEKDALFSQTECLNQSVWSAQKKIPIKLMVGLCCLSFVPSVAFAVDSTPPVVSPVVTGTKGTNNWYTSDVTITWKISDPESAISNTSGCGKVSLAKDTVGSTFTCKAVSAGGTTAKSVTIKRDGTPPKAAIVTPESNGTYKLNQTLQVSYNCTDPTAGVATCSGTVKSGTTITLSSITTSSFIVKTTDQAGNASSTAISYTVVAAPVASAKGTRLLAWNDLGMHCADSDFSVFTLLPPFNNLTSQLIVNGKLVTTTSSPAYSLVYSSITDPTGSINTTSQGKTNFWGYDVPLFGVNLPLNFGLTGNPAPSFKAAALTWNKEFRWYEATGIPITPKDDNLHYNYFPMVQVTASDSSGKAIASTTAVLPVSSEINCKTCHASRTGSSAAMPTNGWVNLTSGSEKDWRLNVLRLHDQKNAGTLYASLLTQKGYGKSLESSARYNGKPILCDTCHNSNALADWGIQGESGVSSMTRAMHRRHARVSLPGSTVTLSQIANRDACYSCHPGPKTQCLRGAMGNPVNATTGKHLMECQSCHGNMLTVSSTTREGWYDMPTCQSCHHDGKRETVAIKSDGTFKTWADKRFASNPDIPAAGWSLYRFSTGHGKLQCEACHNSTHAEYTNRPSATGNQVNDNLEAIKTQGYAAAIRECTVCHSSMPSSINGGPHGMHNLGQSWVYSHHDAFDSTSKSSCYYCHGSTSSGSPLATVKIAKTFKTDDGRSKTFAVNERVTCWSCHNGPNP